MFATAYVVIGELQTKQFHKRHQELVRNIAQDIIYRHETNQPMPRHNMRHDRHNGGPPINPMAGLHEPPPQSSPYERKNMNGLKISAENGDIIFQHKFRGPKKAKKTYVIALTSESGKAYKVQAYAAKAPAFFREVLTRFYSFQFILIFITSTLVSAILSWTITRPLKELGQHSKQYAQGKSGLHISPNLTNRGDELGDLARDIELMTSKVSETLNSQQQLLFDVSHELRAPLARMQAIAGLLETDSVNEKYTERLHREFTYINNLIQQILNYSRLNRDSEQLQNTPLKSLIQDVIETIKIEHPNKNIIFTHNDSDSTIKIYPHLLTGAVENIIRNACVHTPLDTAIDISLTANANTLHINIRDHGEGVPHSDIEKLTTPFYRAGNKMHAKGFGLGLSIAHKSVQKHHGTMNIKNNDGGGLMVAIALPRDIHE